jgi:integrase
MFALASDGRLRGSDVVKATIADLASGGRVRSPSIVTPQKTSRPVQFELVEPSRISLQAWLERRGGALDDFMFPSPVDHGDHTSARQDARLVDESPTRIVLRAEDYGWQSLRRTKASSIYRETGNLGAAQLLPGHRKIESAVGYLSDDIEDALARSEGRQV